MLEATLLEDVHMLAVQPFVEALVKSLHFTLSRLRVPVWTSKRGTRLCFTFATRNCLAVCHALFFAVALLHSIKIPRVYNQERILLSACRVVQRWAVTLLRFVRLVDTCPDSTSSHRRLSTVRITS